MTSFIKIGLPKLYWLGVGIYLLVVLVFVLLYLTEMGNWSDRSYYNWMNFKRIFLASAIPTASIIAKYTGYDEVANLILFVPFALLAVFVVLGILVMYLFSKSI